MRILAAIPDDQRLIFTLFGQVEIELLPLMAIGHIDQVTIRDNTSGGLRGREFAPHLNRDDLLGHRATHSTPDRAMAVRRMIQPI